MDPFTIFVTVVSIISGVASYQQAKKIQRDIDRESRGVEANIESNIKAIPVVYGERRVGGVRVYIDTSKDIGNKYLYMVMAMAEGEVEDIHSIEIDDIPITDEKFILSGLGANFTYEIFYGSDTQSASDLIIDGVAYSNSADVPPEVAIYLAGQEGDKPWNQNHKLNGVAYLAMRFLWDSNAYNGVPNVTAIVKGKKVYDPRNPTAPKAWSTNPALCIRDYLTSTRYGKGIPESAINDTMIAQAANDYDSFVVTPYDGGDDITLFEMNTVLDTEVEIIKNLNDMLMSCRGFLPYVDGKYGMRVDQATNHVMEVNSDHIIGGISIAGTKKEDRFNQVKVNFFNKDKEYKEDTAVFPDVDDPSDVNNLYQTYLAEDGGEPLVDDIKIDGISNYYTAREMAKLFLLRSRLGTAIGFRGTSELMELEVGDTFLITQPTPAWTNKKFQVQEIGLNFDGTVNIQAIEYSDAIYTYNTASEETPFVPTKLPNPNKLAPVTAASASAGSFIDTDGRTVPFIDISWTAPNDALVDRYEIKYTIDDEAVIYSAVAIDTTHRIVEAKGSYDIEIYAVNGFGAKSTGVTLSDVVAVADTSAPSNITGVSISSALQSISLKWTNPIEDDFDLVRIKVADTNAEPTTHSFEVRSDSFVHDIGAYSTTKYYWLAPVDRTGNVGNYVSGGTATTGSIAIGDVPAVAGTFYLTLGNNDAPTNAEFLTAIGRNPIEGDVVVVNKAYFFTRGASAWTAVTEFIDGSLLVSGSVNADRIEVDGTSASVTIDGDTGTPILVQSNGSTVFSVSDLGNVTMNGAYISGIPVTAIPTFESDVRAVVGAVVVDALVPATPVSYTEQDFPTLLISSLKILDTGQSSYSSDYSYNLVLRIDDSWFYEYTSEEDKQGGQDLYYFIEGYNSVTDVWEGVLSEQTYTTPVFYKLPRGGTPQEVYIIDITESLTSVPSYYTGFRVWFRGVDKSQDHFANFEFTPYMTVKSGSSGFIPEDISVVTSTASGGGSLSYDNQGKFTFTPASIPSLSGYATQSYVSTAISNLVDSAPATLDTLNELAAALGDDANFAQTTATALGTKWTQDNTKISNWDTAYGWGNHASANYIVGGGTWTGGTGSSYTTLAQSVFATGNTKFTFYGNSGKMDVITDGEFYANEGASRVFHDAYHPNADKWTTARTLSLTGDVTGSVSIDGSANASITTVVANDSHTHDGRYYTEAESDTRFARVHKGTAVISTAYTTVATIDGNGLASSIDMTIQGTSGSVVINVDAKILVNHSQDILIKADSGIYTQLKIKVTSNNNEDYAIELARVGGTGNTSVAIEIFPRNSETVTFVSTHTYTGNSLELQTQAGTKQLGSGGSNYNFRSDGEFYSGSNRVFHDDYHPNADKWTTARSHTVTLTGDVTGTATQSVDGTGNKTWSISTAVGDNSHNHDHIQGSSYSSDDLNTVASRANAGELHYDAFSNTAPNKPPTSDNANGVITIGQHTGNYTAQLAFSSNGRMYHRDNPTTYGSWQTVFTDGYHPNADKWTTARTIALSGDLNGSVSLDGSSNVTLSAQVVNDSHTHDGRYYTETESDSRFANITGDIFTGNLEVSGGYLQSYGLFYLRDDLNFINAGATGWHTLIGKNEGNPYFNAIDSYRIGGTTVIDASLNITANKFIQSGSTGSQMYALELSRGGTQLWSSDGSLGLGGSSGTETLTITDSSILANRFIELNKVATATGSNQSYSSRELMFQSSGWDTNGGYARDCNFWVRNEAIPNIYPDFDLNFYAESISYNHKKFTIHGRSSGSAYQHPNSATAHGNFDIRTNSDDVGGSLLIGGSTVIDASRNAFFADVSADSYEIGSITAIDESRNASLGSITATTDSSHKWYTSTTNTGTGVIHEFSDQVPSTQKGYLKYFHSDTRSHGSGNAFTLTSTETALSFAVDGKVIGASFHVGFNSTNSGTQIVDSDRNAYFKSLRLTSGENIEWGGDYSVGYPTIAASGSGASGVIGVYPAGGTGLQVLRITDVGADVAGDFKINSTTVIDSNRNLLNVESININTSAQNAIEIFESSGSSGFTYMRFLNDTGSTQYGSIYRSFSSMVYGTSSDYRLKDNVVDLKNAADRINEIPVRRFNFLEHPDRTVDGFIAHEVQAVVPEAVIGNKDEVDAFGRPAYQAIDQSKLVPLLTAGLQEALAEIENLKARLSALEN